MTELLSRLVTLVYPEMFSVLTTYFKFASSEAQEQRAKQEQLFSVGHPCADIYS